MKHILLIDDEQLIYESVKLFLEKEEDDTFSFLDDDMKGESVEEDVTIEYTVHWAASGEEGLDRVQLDDPRFDLILIDMNMPPGWNGVQTIEKIRELDAQIPIALVTANMATDPEIQNMLTQHNVLLFHKPYGKDQLTSLVEEMIT